MSGDQLYNHGRFDSLEEAQDYIEAHSPALGVIAGPCLAAIGPSGEPLSHLIGTYSVMLNIPAELVH